MFKRNLTHSIIAGLKDTPVILINGARQTGKTTLVKQLVKKKIISDYLTFDVASNFTSASIEPEEFISRFKNSVAFDEIQRVPELFIAIKSAVDKNRKPGRFLLTGSANIFLLPRLTESLAGRMEIFTLYPLSQGELEGVKENFIDYIFSNKNSLMKFSETKKNTLFKKIFTGGFPEIQKRNIERRNAWFGSYINTVLQRDIRDISHINSLTDIPRLLQLLASRSMQQLNLTELSRSISIPQTTLDRYLTLLQAVYFIDLLKPYSTNLGKRLIRTPKLFFNDTGLLSYLLGLDFITSNEVIKGMLLENFILMELKKQIRWSSLKPQIFFFRDVRGKEVDIVLEDRAGNIIGIEVKATSSLNESQFNGLKFLETEYKKKFKKGILFYTGNESLPFGKNIYALPVNALWELGVVKS